MNSSIQLLAFSLGSKLKRMRSLPGSLPHAMDAWQALRARPVIVYFLPSSSSQLQMPSNLAKEVKSNLLDLSRLSPSGCLPDSLDFDPLPIKLTTPHHLIWQTRSGHYQVTSDVFVPRTKTKMGNRAFEVAGPHTWNSLPATVRETETLPAFKKQLKLYLIGNPEY